MWSKVRQVFIGLLVGGIYVNFRIRQSHELQSHCAKCVFAQQRYLLHEIVPRNNMANKKFFKAAWFMLFCKYPSLAAEIE